MESIKSYRVMLSSAGSCFPHGGEDRTSESINAANEVDAIAYFQTRGYPEFEMDDLQVFENGSWVWVI